MADFDQAFERAILAEGGFKLHQVSGDTGGLTYAGIARNKNPDWVGWAYLDAGETPPTALVREYYKTGWWDPIQGDAILDQDVAYTFYSFATNSSARLRPVTAIKLAQLAARTTPDGVVGPKTVAAINRMSPELFILRFGMARMARYADICNKNRSQREFLLGWLNRTLRESAT